MASGYEFYFLVLKQYFSHSMRSFAKYCYHWKINFISSRRRMYTNKGLCHYIAHARTWIGVIRSLTNRNRRPSTTNRPDFLVRLVFIIWDEPLSPDPPYL